MQFGSGDTAGVRTSFFTGTRAALVVAAFGAFGMITVGRAFITRWMGAEFLDAYPILVLLTLAMFFDMWQLTSVSSLYATMNQKSYAQINLLEAGINVVLSILLVRRYGMIGVAIGTLVPGICVRTIVQPWIVQKKLGISMKSYLLSSAATLSRCLVCLVAPVLIMTHWLQPNYISIIVTSTAALVLFAIPIWIWEFKGVGYMQFRQSLSARLSRSPV
jgi:O-antigen/teichoic acid export membrane protein